MRRIPTILAVALGGSLLAACGGSPAPSAVPAAASIPPVPVISLPVLPAGWGRQDVSGFFSVGVPETWMVLTTAERDDPAAADALKVKYPDFSNAVDSATAQMRAQGIYLHAYDIAGDTSPFTTNMNILKVTGPLTADFAKAAAAVVQGQFKIEDPLNVESVTSPAGAYRYQFAENLLEDSLAGMQYLIPAGSDVYVMTFLTTVKQTQGYGPTAVSMAETFAAAASTSSAPADLAAADEPTQVVGTSDETGAVTVGVKPGNIMMFTISDPLRITRLKTYHYVPGGLDHTGTIALADYKTGKVLYGPFPTVGADGPGGATNAYWIADVDFILPKLTGDNTYLVVDSEPSTWSSSERALGGFFWGYGEPATSVPVQ